jgi:nucleoside-diphosphate-sugar epimerase
MSKIKVFCFGFGQVAKYFVKKIIKENQIIELNISSRQKTNMKTFKGINFNSYEFNDEKKDKDIDIKIKEADCILISIPPITGEDVVIKNFKENFKNVETKWITYLSATSVYGNHDGEWVNESSITRPTTTSGISRLKAEGQWLQLSKENNLPLQIFRLSGIYSTQNNILKRLVAKQTKIVKKENHFFSRIHVEDIANILFHSLKKLKRNEIYNISDDKPAPQEEVASYGSKLLKIDSPKLFELNSLEDGMLKDFYKDSKKVNNKKMKDFFNYQLTYPTYKEGLDSILNDIV